MTSTPRRRAVLALGGNAITRADEPGTVENDYRNLRRSLETAMRLLEDGYQLVLTHGNGPQIGNQMLRVELARGAAPDLPIDIMVADLQGGLGYMIERVMREKMRRRGLVPRICCMLTMVLVDPDDPSMRTPTKFVGPPFDEREAERRRREDGWNVAEDRGRGWRRVVPSPRPVGIVQRQEILTLLDAGCVVISGGGGGIPIVRTDAGDVRGVEGVVDKDRSSAIIASAIGAPDLFVLTAVPEVVRDFGTPDAAPIREITVSEAERLLAEGQFPPGSMGPKIEAACGFLKAGGGRVVVTDDVHFDAALRGEAGTTIVARGS